MHKYGAHGATDVSKFGLLGHAAGLAKAQAAEVRKLIDCGKIGLISLLKVSFVIHNLPLIAHMERLSAALEKLKGQAWGLAQGLCPEVSGGLLIVMPREEAAAYCKDMERLEVRLLCFCSDRFDQHTKRSMSVELKRWTKEIIQSEFRGVRVGSLVLLRGGREKQK